MRSQPIAAPFRNPMPNAFTTPRKPFDEVNLSEASGAEDSPAVTENSDYPNDTPEADRLAELTMGSTSAITPSKISKVSRYSKSGMVTKKASGRGEIRPVTGKRRRHVGDRDVSFVNFDQSRFGEDSDMDSYDERAPRQTRNRTRGNKAKQGGFLGSFFHFLNEHPNAPENLSKWISFGFNFSLVFACATMLWSTVHSVQSDLRLANEAARTELVSKMNECSNSYTLNKCSDSPVPAVKGFCDEWYECMMQNPEAVMKVKVTAKQVAEVFNEFTDTMSLRSWVSGHLTSYPASPRGSTLTLSAGNHHYRHRRLLIRQYCAVPASGVCEARDNAPTQPELCARCHVRARTDTDAVTARHVGRRE
jgi:hypothetical protein